MENENKLIDFIDEYDGDIFVPEKWSNNNYAIISLDIYNYNKANEISELLSKALFEWRDSKRKDNCEHPFSCVISKCNGEINYCLKCKKDI